jgi:hypothetical protein
MPVEYVCAVNNGHKESCGAPRTPPPQCCGKPMVLARCLVKPTVAQPSTAGAGKPQAAPTCKPSTPQQPKTETQKS